MSKKDSDLDLELWMDKEIILRQNKLKHEFWNILSETANSFSSEEIKTIHKTSRGAKLTKGNNLAGFPYQVLDISRDFNPENGLNIRVLNWFGHGMFIFILLGKNHPKKLDDAFIDTGFKFCLTNSEWDYKRLIQKDSATQNPKDSEVDPSKVVQWMLQLTPTSSSTDTITMLRDKIKKVFNLLGSHLG
jgi:hypothetical protein